MTDAPQDMQIKDMRQLELLTPVGKAPGSPALVVSCPPQVHCGRSVRGLNLLFLAGLAPVLVLAVATYGLDALRVLAAASAAAVFTEYLCAVAQGQGAKVGPGSVDDLHSLTLGLVFACFLPASAPWWLAVGGAAITVALGKMVFGGLGSGPLSAAMVGWAVCAVSWPGALSAEFTLLNVDLPIPLFELHHYGPDAVGATATDMLLGRQLGPLGASQPLGALIGGLILLATGRVRWEIPVAFLGSLAFCMAFFDLLQPAQHGGPSLHVLGGSAVFAAFFAATDDSSSPALRTPMLLFGVLCGIMVALIRVYGVYPDGAPLAILVANLFTPALRSIKPKPFGYPGAGAKAKAV